MKLPFKHWKIIDFRIPEIGDFYISSSGMNILFCEHQLLGPRAIIECDLRVEYRWPKKGERCFTAKGRITQAKFYDFNQLVIVEEKMIGYYYDINGDKVRVTQKYKDYLIGEIKGQAPRFYDLEGKSLTNQIHLRFDTFGQKQPLLKQFSVGTLITWWDGIEWGRGRIVYVHSTKYDVEAHGARYRVPKTKATQVIIKRTIEEWLDIAGCELFTGVNRTEDLGPIDFKTFYDLVEIV